MLKLPPPPMWVESFSNSSGQLKMSLHIGRLSPDVRQGYLEHLFQRFGNCTVRLKDGYGFAVFDSNKDAARAMRALHGKFVCGKRITVNWSKQQPRFPKDFRSSRIAESSHRRAPRDGNLRFRDSIVQKNHPASHDQGHSPDVAPEKKSSDVALEKKSSDGALEKKSDDDVEDLKDVRETVGEDPVEMKRNGDGTNDANAIEHDRWEETGKGNHGRDDDFDRYEPYHGYVRQEEREKVVRASSHETYHHRRSLQKSKEYPGERFDMNHDKSKSPPAAYNRGAAGHIACDCSQKTDGKSEEWRDALIRQEEKMLRLGKFGSTLRRRPAAHDCPQKADVKFEAWRDAFIRQGKTVARPRRFGSPSRRQPEESHVDMVVQTHHTIQDDIKQFSDRTRSAQKLSNVSREDKKHIRCSEGISSQAPKESRKRSRSKRSRGSSLSADRTTSCSRSRCSCSCSRSRTRSRAHSPSHSAHSSSKSSQPTQPKGLRSVAISNVNYPAPLPVSGSPQHNSPSVVENKNLDFLVNSPLEGNLDFKTTTGLKHMCDYQQDIKDSRLNAEAPVIPFKLKIRRNGESPVSGHDANVDGYTATNLNKNMVRDDNFANGVQGRKTNCEDASSVKSNKDILVKTGSKSLKLTTIEVVSALKHYGMEAHGTDLRKQPVEKYFGAARLWPWEVIYYRKLKKGPISTENYAKQLEQNKKYSIVDQYVRSSSGWWECH